MPLKVSCFKYTTIVIAMCLFFGCSGIVQAEQPYQVEWAAQIGTSRRDLSVSVAVDSVGNAYMSGYTYGSLGGPSAGSSDAFLTKFDASGNELWSQQIGTSSLDFSNAVAVDGAGNAYLSGATNGRLGGSSPGITDAFLTKYDPSGVELWTQQVGSRLMTTRSFSVAVDNAGNPYISGHVGGSRSESYDSLLTKFDSSGNELWSQQIGTAERDQSHSVAVDGAGNAFISGYTRGNLDGPNAGGDDAFLTKFDTTGNEQWSRQIGTTSNDYGNSVAVDGAGNAYMTGYTTGGSLGGPNMGGYDAFVTKYDTFGNELWIRQIGSTGQDYGYSVAVDDAGNAYITGDSSGSLGGSMSGETGAYLMKFDTLGNQLWSQQTGTTRVGNSRSVALDGAGNAYISGWTYGNIGAPNAGDEDAFLVKFTIPEPTSFSLITLIGLTLLRRSHND